VDARTASGSRSQASASLHADLDARIDRFFALEDGQPPHYAHLKSALRLSRSTGAEFDGATLISDLYACLEQTLDRSKRTPSRENWRYQKKLHIASHNPSPEKKLEKMIARSEGEDWVNQVPTASGLLTSGERHRNIDLVHRVHSSGYELIELKAASDTPLFAAMEILKYGLVFLYSRRHRNRLGYSAALNPLLWADEIHLRVLAPADYYHRFAFGWLVPCLNQGLAETLRPELDQGLTIDFDFQVFPDGFLPSATGRALLEALAGRRPAYP